MRIATLNCAGTRTKLSTLIYTLTQITFDILLLQETHSLERHEINRINSELKVRSFFNHGTSRSRGTGIIVKESLPNVKVLDHSSLGDCGNGILLELKINGL